MFGPSLEHSPVRGSCSASIHTSSLASMRFLGRCSSDAGDQIPMLDELRCAGNNSGQGDVPFKGGRTGTGCARLLLGGSFSMVGSL
jgi:hypothetical protein